MSVRKSEPESLLAAPATLFDPARGAPPLGRYVGLVAGLDTHHWDGSCGLLSPRRTRRKTWIFLGAFSERFMAGFAIADAGLVATGFAYVFDRERKKLWEDKIAVPLGFADSFQGRLEATWALERKTRSFRIAPEGAGQLAEFKRLKAVGESAPFALQLRTTQSGKGMSTIAPSSPDRPFNFTYKDCDLAIDLALDLGGERHDVHARGMLDFTLGYPPRRTFWNWAAGNGTADDMRIGFNLVAHFNSGMENALWLDGRLVPLPQATFSYDPKDLSLPWRVSTANGAFEATFEPEGRRTEDLQAAVLASKFAQLFGRFKGTVTVDGKQRPFTAQGVVEEHHALW